MKRINADSFLGLQFMMLLCFSILGIKICRGNIWNRGSIQVTDVTEVCICREWGMFFLNTRTPWWDGSVIYGNNNDRMRRVRTFKDVELKIWNDGLLEYDGKGIPISGDVRNCWAGFSLLQALFVKEHDAVCDMLKVHHPDFDDERLYQHARLVTSAIIAKIHTIDWTVEL